MCCVSIFHLKLYCRKSDTFEEKAKLWIRNTSAAARTSTLFLPHPGHGLVQVYKHKVPLYDAINFVLFPFIENIKCNIALLIHSSFINSWGMKNLGISKYWCAPISLKLPCNYWRARKQFLCLSITVFSLVRLAMLLLITNQSSVLSWRRKCFRFMGNTVFLLVRLVMWLLKTNQSSVLSWRKKCFRVWALLYSYWLDW